MTSVKGAHFGGRLRCLRLKREWTLAELATRAGMSRTQVGRLERGESDPRLSAIQKLATALGVDAATLIQGLPVPAL